MKNFEKIFVYIFHIFIIHTSPVYINGIISETLVLFPTFYDLTACFMEDAFATCVNKSRYIIQSEF